MVSDVTYPSASDDKEEDDKRLELVVKRHKQLDDGVQGAIVRSKATLMAGRERQFVG